MDKKSFRKKCLKKLKANISNSYILDFKAMKKIEQLIEIHQPSSILFYLPMSLEVDLRYLMKKYRKKLTILTPFIEGESFKMVQYRLPLKYNSLKIYEPPNSQRVFRKVDMIIVPVVGVDGAYKRVGFGKGMYDRFYERLKNKPVVVFVQRVKCYTDKIVTDGFDIHADYYVTPKELMIIGKNSDNRYSSSLRRCISGRCSSIFKCKKDK